MEFKRTNSSRNGAISGRSAPPRLPTAALTRSSTSTHISTPGRSSTPRSQRAAAGTTSTAQKPPRPSATPSSTRGAPPGLPRPEGFKRTGTGVSLSAVNNNNNSSSCSISSTVNANGGGANTLPPMRPLSGKTGGNGRVNVYARVRASAPNETAEDQQQLAVHMKDNSVDVMVPQKGCFTFTFDGTFWSNENASDKPFSSQEDVFQVIGKPLVENALAGYNAAIMAYGQTGSGKTYTAFGPVSSLGTAEEGLIPRVCEMIFARAAASSQKGVTYRLCASMLEVYLEDVFDLLNHRKMVAVRNDYRDNSFHVVGAKSVPVHSYEELAALLKKAEPLRTFAATAIHDRSSRAHTLFQLEVQTSFESKDIVPRASKILLADLAGSERIKIAHTETGLPFEQARNINLSLLALGSCIEAVATRKGYNQNIPEFRNSTLTKLLKEYLGGNSVSAMVVTIAPSARDAHLSVQTLRFADRAKQMATYAKINTVTPVDATDDDTEKLGKELGDAYIKKKEALYAEYKLQYTIDQLLKKIAILEAQLMKATNEDLIARLQEEIEGHQKSLAEADTQLQEQRRILYPNEVTLEEQLKDLNTRMQEMKEEHEEAMESLMTEDLRKYTEKMKANESHYNDRMASMMDAHRDEVSRLQQMLEEANAKIANLTASVTETKEELRIADEHLEEMQSAFKELEDMSTAVESKLQNQNQQLRSDLAEHQEKLDELNTVLRDLEERYANDTHAAEEKQADMQGQIGRLEGDVAERDQKLEEMMAAQRDLEERYANDAHAAEERQADMQGQIERLEAQIERLEGDVAERDQKLEEMMAAQRDLEERYANDTHAAEERQADMQGQIERLEAQIERLEGDVAERDQKLEEMMAAQRDLEERYANDTHAAEEKQADMQGQIERLEGDVAERDQKLEEMMAAQRDLEERYANDTHAAEERQADMQGQIERLEGDVAERDQKLEEMMAAQRDLEERYANDTHAAEERQADMQGQIERLEGDVAERDQKLEEMMAAQRDLEERYANDTHAAEERQADMQGQIERLEGDVAERDQKLEEMMAAQRDLEERYANDTHAAEERQADMQGQIERLEGDVAERDQKLEEMMAAQRDLEERYANDTHAAEERQADMQGQIGRLEAQIAQLEAQIERLEGDVAERDQKLEEMMAAQRDLEERYANDTHAAEERQADMQGQIERLEGDVAERDQKLEEMMAAQRDLEERYANDTHAAEERQADMQGQIERLEAELNDKQAAYENAEIEHDEAIRTLYNVVEARDHELEEMMVAKKDLEERHERDLCASEEKQSKMQDEIEQLKADVADGERRLEEMMAAQKDLEGRYESDMRAAEEREAELQGRLEALDNELQATEKQLREEMAAYEAELDDWRGKLDAEQRQSEEHSAMLERRITELDGELGEANGRIEGLTHYLMDVERYTRGAYETTLEGLQAKQREGLEELSLQTTVNMAEYANATAARLQLMTAVEELQRMLEETKHQANKEIGELQNMLRESRSAGRSRLEAVMALVQSAQGALAQAVEADAEDVEGASLAGSVEPSRGVSIALGDCSNKENDARRGSSRPMAAHKSNAF